MLLRDPPRGPPVNSKSGNRAVNSDPVSCSSISKTAASFS
jgi:hypothetical protein